MKILSWNLKACGLVVKRRSIKEIVYKENPNIVVFQEVKKEMVNKAMIGNLWRSKFKEWILLPSISRSGGILVIWDVRSVTVN